MDERSLNRIIEMAWEDRTPFEAITFQFELSESEVTLAENWLKSTGSPLFILFKSLVIKGMAENKEFTLVV